MQMMFTMGTWALLMPDLHQSLSIASTLRLVPLILPKQLYDLKHFLVHNALQILSNRCYLVLCILMSLLSSSTPVQEDRRRTLRENDWQDSFLDLKKEKRLMENL